MPLKATPAVLPVREARASLSRLLAEFRERGLSADPVFVGSHRRPDGVLIPMALFEELIPAIEDLLVSDEIRRRIAADTGERVSHEDLLAELGVNPATLK
jgi:PHD/YefM family antitoxin component YafN of YafNO toxin-antitoxin module